MPYSNIERQNIIGQVMCIINRLLNSALDDDTIDEFLNSLGIELDYDKNSQFSLYNKRTKILIIGSLNGSKNEYINCAKKYNINEDNLDFINYSEIKNYGVEKLRYSSKYSDIICGSIPHKIKGMGDVSSFIAEIKTHPEEYPKLYNAVEKLSITKFKDALKKSRYFQKFYK